MKMLKRGDPCPCCGQPIMTDDADTLRLLTDLGRIIEKSRVGTELTSAVERTRPMQRLTWRLQDGSWGMDGVDIRDVPARVYGAIYKLKKYEDTGLQPEDVELLKDLQGGSR